MCPQVHDEPRTMNPTLKRPLPAWALAALMCACTAAPQPPAAVAMPAPAPAPAPQQSNAPVRADDTTAPALAQIVSLIGSAACDTADQCRTVGIGDKPCGGPEAYLAWSSAVTKPDALTALAARHRAARRAQNERSELRSNCAVTPDPGAVCRPRASDGQRTCQLGQGGGRSAV